MSNHELTSCSEGKDPVLEMKSLRDEMLEIEKRIRELLAQQEEKAAKVIRFWEGK